MKQKSKKEPVYTHEDIKKVEPFYVKACNIFNSVSGNFIFLTAISIGCLGIGAGLASKFWQDEAIKNGHGEYNSMTGKFQYKEIPQTTGFYYNWDTPSIYTNNNYVYSNMFKILQ